MLATTEKMEVCFVRTNLPAKINQVSDSASGKAFKKMSYFNNDDFVANCYENRFTFIVDNKLDTSDALYLTTQLSLSLCKFYSPEELRLHCYYDSNNTPHPGMSEYGLVVLESKKTTSLEQVLKSYKEVFPNKHVALVKHPTTCQIIGLGFFENIEVSKQLTRKEAQLWQAGVLELTECNPHAYLN